MFRHQVYRQFSQLFVLIFAFILVSLNFAPASPANATGRVLCVRTDAWATGDLVTIVVYTGTLTDPNLCDAPGVMEYVDVNSIDLNSINFAGALPLSKTIYDVNNDTTGDLVMQYRLQDIRSIEQYGWWGAIVGNTLNGDQLYGPDMVEFVSVLPIPPAPPNQPIIVTQPPVVGVTQLPPPTEPVIVQPPSVLPLVVSYIRPVIESEPVTNINQTAFQVAAFDPNVGSADGSGIAQVNFQLVGPSGTTLYTHSESNATYCAFTDQNNTCLPMPSDMYAGLTAGTYIVMAQAVTFNGVASPWVNRIFVVSGTTPPPSTGSTVTPPPTQPGQILPIVTFAQPVSEGQAINSIGQTGFQVIAFDPLTGSANGSGIAQVSFELYGPNAALIYQHTEGTAIYCAYTDQNGVCLPMPSDAYAALTNGVYTLRVQATNNRGQLSGWISRTFNFTGRTTPTPTTPVPTTPAPTTPTAGITVQMVTPAGNGATFTTRDQTRFQVMAFNSAAGTQDGSGIASVNFQLVNMSSGSIVYTGTENTQPYCTFTDTRNRCQPMTTALYRQLQAGYYKLRAQAVATNGQTSNWIECTLILSKGGTVTPTATTPVPTTPAPTTPAPTTPAPTTPAPQPLFLNIVSPASSNQAITNISQTGFQAIAYNPAVGTQDGAGVASVAFEILNPAGQSIHTRTETTAAFCAFSGDTPCNVMPDTLYTSLTNGTYTLRVQMTAATGTVTAWVSKTFVINRATPTTPAPTTPAPTTPAPTTPAPTTPAPTTPAPTTPVPTTPAPTTPAPTTPAPNGRTFYVAPTGQDSNAGSETAPYRTIQYAAGRAQPGDTIIVRAGTYYEKVTPNSGTVNAPVTIKGYPGERPLIDGDNRVYRNIEVIAKSYIVFENLRVEEPVDVWAHIENSDHITLQNIEFMNPTYPSGMQRNFYGVTLRYSSYNKILNSRFDHWGRYQGGDQEGNHIGIIGDMTRGGYNLIEGNYFTYGAQGCIIVNGPLNVIRNNIFDNDWQKGIYLGYFVNPGDAPPGTVYPAYRNLVEGNTFLRSNNSEVDHGGLGYEETAVGSIFRRNVIRNTDHLGLIVTVFGNYAPLDYGNHIFNNTIVNNGLDRFEWMGTGISITNHGLGTELHDDIVKNNIIYGNLAGAGNNPVQLSLEISGSSNRPPFGGMIVAGNLIENPRATTCQQNLNANNNGGGECPIYVEGVGDGNVQWFNTRYPQTFWGNREGNPNFVAYNPSANQFDLHLQANSPAIDAGVSLTETVSAGSGTTIQLRDAGYFHAGYNGMIAADSIRVGSETVTITSINYDTNTITVDRAISWNANTPVNLPFNGNGPDIGAFER